MVCFHEEQLNLFGEPGLHHVSAVQQSYVFYVGYVITYLDRIFQSPLVSMLHNLSAFKY